jgi:hypothetical protein
MDNVLLLEEKVTFSPQMPPQVNRLLQEAVPLTATNAVQAEWLFLRAQTADSHCLQTYFALYKFYFFHKRLVEAEYFTLQGLEEAARQGGFPSDYRRLAREPEKWDLYANEIGLFYLYSLKAMAFIKLRQEQVIEAQLILTHLKQLDPQDLCGASVIMDLAAGITTH